MLILEITILITKDIDLHPLINVKRNCGDARNFEIERESPPQSSFSKALTLKIISPYFRRAEQEFGEEAEPPILHYSRGAQTFTGGGHCLTFQNLRGSKQPCQPSTMC